MPNYLRDLIRANSIDKRSISKGLSRFLIMVPSIIADYPKLAEQISKVRFDLYSQKALILKEVYFVEKKSVGKEEEEDTPFVEDYYRIIAHFLRLIADNEGLPKL